MDAVDDFVRQWKDDSPHILAHTSGSTGVPKEVRLLKSDMRLSAQATCQFFNISSHSCLLLPLSPDYIAGKMQIVRALISGASLDYSPPSNSVFQAPRSHYDMVPIVPSQIDGFIACGIQADNLIIGGAPLSPDQERKIQAKYNAYATYGMTETCSHVALRKLGTPFYKAMPNIWFGTDHRGCLVIKSKYLSFRKLVTNDVVDLLDCQSFIFRGRADYAINSGGIKIHPQEVETALSELMEGRAFYITSRCNEKWGQEPILVLLDDKPINESLLLHQAKQLLGIKAPKAIMRDTKPCYTSSGKLIRRQF